MKNYFDLKGQVAVKMTMEKFGRVDILMNNTSIINKCQIVSYLLLEY